jgi:hypothetical protein
VLIATTWGIACLSWSLTVAGARWTGELHTVFTNQSPSKQQEQTTTNEQQQQQQQRTLYVDRRDRE